MDDMLFGVEDFDTLAEQQATERRNRYAIRVGRKIIAAAYAVPFAKTPKLSIDTIVEQYDEICPVIIDVFAEVVSLKQILSARTKDIPFASLLCDLASTYEDRPVGVVCKTNTEDLLVRCGEFKIAAAALLGDTSNHVDWIASRMIANHRVVILPLVQSVERNASLWRDVLQYFPAVQNMLE